MTKEEIQERIVLLLKRGAIGIQVEVWRTELKYLIAEYRRILRSQGAYLEGEWVGGYYGGK